MSVLGTAKHSSCNQCIDTWQYSCIVCLIRRAFIYVYVLVMETAERRRKEGTRF